MRAMIGAEFKGAGRKVRSAEAGRKFLGILRFAQDDSKAEGERVC
jgi:hypothetical protein